MHEPSTVEPFTVTVEYLPLPLSIRSANVRRVEKHPHRRDAVHKATRHTEQVLHRADRGGEIDGHIIRPEVKNREPVELPCKSDKCLLERQEFDLILYIRKIVVDIQYQPAVVPIDAALQKDCQRKRFPAHFSRSDRVHHGYVLQ